MGKIKQTRSSNQHIKATKQLTSVHRGAATAGSPRSAWASACRIWVHPHLREPSSKFGIPQRDRDEGSCHLRHIPYFPDFYGLSTLRHVYVFCFWITLKSTVAFVTFATFERSFNVSRIILLMNCFIWYYDGTVIRAVPRVSALVFSKSITSALQRGSAFINSTIKCKTVLEPFPRRAMATSWSYSYRWNHSSTYVQVPRSFFYLGLRLSENGLFLPFAQNCIDFGWNSFFLVFSWYVHFCVHLTD